LTERLEQIEGAAEQTDIEDERGNDTDYSEADEGDHPAVALLNEQPMAHD
jgi:hypothetical protein